MTSTTITPPPTPQLDVVERRLLRWGLKPDTAVAIVAILIIFVADAQSLTLIPLVRTMEAQYHISAAEASWAISILSIVGAAGIPLVTRLGDKFGMRRLVLLSLIVCVIGNLLCAIASGFALLLAGRIVLGLGAAVPLTYAILRERATSVKGTNRGVGFITAALGAAISLSFLLGGVVLQLKGSIHTVFWVMVILAVLALAIAWVLLPDSTNRDSSEIDYVGASLLAAGLVPIVLAVTEGNTWGWRSLPVLILLVGGAVVLAIFVAVELRVPHPLLNLRITFRRTAWPAYVIGGLAFGLGLYSSLTIISYVEVPPIFGYGFGSSVLVAAYFLCPISLFIVIGGMMVAPMMARVGTKATIIIGGAIIAVDFFFLAGAHDHIWQYLVGTSLWGLGFSFVFSGANAAYLHAAKDGEAAMFAATHSAVSSAVGSLGAAVFTVILTARFIPKTHVPDPAQFGWLWFFGGCGALVIIVLALIYRKPEIEEAGHLTVSTTAVSTTAPAGIPVSQDS